MKINHEKIRRKSKHNLISRSQFLFISQNTNMVNKIKATLFNQQEYVVLFNTLLLEIRIHFETNKHLRSIARFVDFGDLHFIVAYDVLVFIHLVI